jgi:hypothetical protein
MFSYILYYLISHQYQVIITLLLDIVGIISCYNGYYNCHYCN